MNFILNRLLDVIQEEVARDFSDECSSSKDGNILRRQGQSF